MLAAVIGRSPDHHRRQSAWLDGYRAVRLARETSPILVEAAGARLEGLLVQGIEKTERDRILFFESVAYDHKPISVSLGDGSFAEAHAFLASAQARSDDALWTFSDWQLRHKAQSLREAALWMALYGYVDAEEGERLWDEALATGEALDRMVQRVRRGLLSGGPRDTAESA